jgi:hypothetical protein
VTQRGGPGLRAGVAVALLVSLLGCSRHAEIFEAGDAGIIVISGPEPPDEIPVVEDSGIASESLPECAERPTGECLGANDFPCTFPNWVTLAADACMAKVNCGAQGWLGVSLGDDGCVSAIEMTEPHDEFVACLVEEFGKESCHHCAAMHSTRFLGAGVTDGCKLRCTEDDDCPSGYHCDGVLCANEFG